jgi:hypothetical protein
MPSIKVAEMFLSKWTLGTEFDFPRSQNERGAPEKNFRFAAVEVLGLNVRL